MLGLRQLLLLHHSLPHKHCQPHVANNKQAPNRHHHRYYHHHYHHHHHHHHHHRHHPSPHHHNKPFLVFPHFLHKCFTGGSSPEVSRGVTYCSFHRSQILLLCTIVMEMMITTEIIIMQCTLCMCVAGNIMNRPL